MTTTTAWTFNRNYEDLEQVAEFFPAYIEAFAAVTAKGGYPYNDDFRGRIPGLAGCTQKDEDTAIYLLQGVRDLCELFDELAALRADGYVDLDVPVTAEAVKYKGVAEWGFYSSGTGLRVWHDARLLLYHSSTALLPKGKRTNGLLLSGKILVKR